MVRRTLRRTGAPAAKAFLTPGGLLRTATGKTSRLQTGWHPPPEACSTRRISAGLPRQNFVDRAECELVTKQLPRFIWPMRLLREWLRRQTQIVEFEEDHPGPIVFIIHVECVLTGIQGDNGKSVPAAYQSWMF